MQRSDGTGPQKPPERPEGTLIFAGNRFIFYILYLRNPFGNTRTHTHTHRHAQCTPWHARRRWSWWRRCSLLQLRANGAHVEGMPAPAHAANSRGEDEEGERWRPSDGRHADGRSPHGHATGRRHLWPRVRVIKQSSVGRSVGRSAEAGRGGKGWSVARELKRGAAPTGLSAAPYSEPASKVPRGPGDCEAKGSALFKGPREGAKRGRHTCVMK